MKPLENLKRVARLFTERGYRRHAAAADVKSLRKMRDLEPDQCRKQLLTFRAKCIVNESKFVSLTRNDYQKQV